MLEYWGIEALRVGQGEGPSKQRHAASDNDRLKVLEAEISVLKAEFWQVQRWKHQQVLSLRSDARPCVDLNGWCHGRAFKGGPEMHAHVSKLRVGTITKPFRLLLEKISNGLCLLHVGGLFSVL